MRRCQSDLRYTQNLPHRRFDPNLGQQFSNQAILLNRNLGLWARREGFSPTPRCRTAALDPETFTDSDLWSGGTPSTTTKREVIPLRLRPRPLANHITLLGREAQGGQTPCLWNDRTNHSGITRCS